MEEVFKCIHCGETKDNKNAVCNHEIDCQLNPENKHKKYLALLTIDESKKNYGLQDQNDKIVAQGFASFEIAQDWAKENNYIAVYYFENEPSNKKMSRLLGFKNVEDYISYHDKLVKK